MNASHQSFSATPVSAGCHINDVMNRVARLLTGSEVSAGCHINDVMNFANRPSEYH